MILSCNSCEKKFVVPDNAIPASGRLVQCSSCGNKWTQYPINTKAKQKEKIPTIKQSSQKIQNIPKKTKTKKIKKKTGPDLYSPEYLAKKHGIRIGGKSIVNDKKTKTKKRVNFGFYSFLIITIILTISILRLIYFAQDTIKRKIPITEIYIDYLFETIRNIKDIIQNFLAGY